MSEFDDCLQENLQALESGAALEEILAKAPDPVGEMASLVQLAAAIRGLPHPQPSSNLAPARQPEQRPAADAAATRPLQRRQPAAVPRVWRPAWGALAALALLAVLLVGGLGLWLAGPPSAKAATLMDVQGQVEIASSAEASDWRSAANGDQVKAGQRIRTQAASGATLVFYEGSRTTISPNADLVLSELDGGWGSALRVDFDQLAGKTAHSVVPLRGRESRFVVHTPAGKASVHGTNFNVLVAKTGLARFAVNTGKVEVSNDFSQVFLTAGQVTAAETGESIAQPAYQFSVQGTLTAQDGETWTVAGVSFTVTDQTVIDGDPQVGEVILVEGRLLEDDTRAADTITAAQDEQQVSSFTGTLTAMEDGVWLIGGTAVTVDEATVVSEGLNVGDAVRVTFAVQEDGSWLALQIESLQEAPEPEQTPTATSELDATPSPTGETGTPSTEPTGTTTVEPGAEDVEAICTGANPHPTGMTLAQRYGVTYEEIMGWFCQHFGFGEIDLAYGLSQETGIPVEEIFAMRSSMGWGEIKQQLQEAPGQSLDKGKPTDQLQQTRPTQRPKPTQKPKPTKKPK